MTRIYPTFLLTLLAVMACDAPLPTGPDKFTVEAVDVDAIPLNAAIVADIVDVTGARVSIRRGAKGYWNTVRLIVWTDYPEMPADQRQKGRYWARSMTYECKTTVAGRPVDPANVTSAWAYTYVNDWRRIVVYKEDITTEIRALCGR